MQFSTLPNLLEMARRTNHVHALEDNAVNPPRQDNCEDRGSCHTLQNQGACGLLSNLELLALDLSDLMKCFASIPASAAFGFGASAI